MMVRVKEMLPCLGLLIDGITFERTLGAVHKSCGQFFQNFDPPSSQMDKRVHLINPPKKSHGLFSYPPPIF